MLMISLFSEFDFASLYEDRRTYFADEMYSAYTILLCVCEESDFTKIATLINFHNALQFYTRKEGLQATQANALIIFNSN